MHSKRWVDHGWGVIEFVDVLPIDPVFLEGWLARRKEQEPSDYTPLDDGTFMNRGGYVYTAEQIAESPGRLLFLDKNASDEDIEFVQEIDKAMSECIHDYCFLFPDVKESIWWRAQPHVATYGQTAHMGFHHDNLVGAGSESEQAIYSVLTGSLILKDCDKGGYLGFKYPNKHVKPKPGSALIYSAGYLGTHEVTPVESGERVSFLEFFGHGSLPGSTPFIHSEE